MNLDPNVLASVFGMTPSPEDRQKGLLRAILERGGAPQEAMPDLGRQRGIASLALLSGDDSLGQFGNAQLQDATRREKDAESTQERALTHALALMNQQQAQKEREIDNARADTAEARQKKFQDWQMANPAQQVVAGQGGQLVAYNPRNISAGTQPVPGPGGVPLQKDKPLEQAQTKELETLGQDVRNIADLKSTFKPQYAGGGMAGKVLTQAAQTLGDWAPDKASGALPQLSEESGNFWAKFSRLVDLPQRNALFGSSLTPTEKASFDAASRIKPGASPETIQKTMEEMDRIARGKLSRLTGSLRTEGYNPAGIDALTQDTQPAAPSVVPHKNGKKYQKDAEGNWFEL